MQVTLTEFGKEKVKEGRIQLLLTQIRSLNGLEKKKVGQIIDFMNEFYEVSKEVMNDMYTEDQKEADWHSLYDMMTSAFFMLRNTCKGVVN